MRDDFAVFIISHGRAGQVDTLETLKRRGYGGKWFVVVDNEDEQQERYIGEYGAENVVVFDKQEYIDKVDTISTSGERKTPLFARNAVCDIAKQKGLKFFAMYDDDLTRLSYRYEGGGKLRAKDIQKLDEIFEEMISFMGFANIDAMAFTNAGGLIGGVQGRWSEGLRRQGANTYILRTDREYPFIGVYNEDMNFSLLLASAGKLVFEYTHVCFYAPERGSNSGGLSETYKSKNWYYINFHSVVCCPWCCKTTKKDSLQVSWRNALPMIINERWKKSCEMTLPFSS